MQRASVGIYISGNPVRKQCYVLPFVFAVVYSSRAYGKEELSTQSML